jgi:hypothetical protein
LQEAYCICKLKHDIRVESKVDLARREIQEILKTNVSDLGVLPTLFRSYPFIRLDEKIIDRMTRLLYLGKSHGFICGLRSFDSLIKLTRNATYLREIYAVLLRSDDELSEILAAMGYGSTQGLEVSDENRFITISPGTQIFNQLLDNGSYLTALFLTPLQTMLEYTSEVVKLPYVTFTKQYTNLSEKLDKMEQGVDRGLVELLEHLGKGEKRMPWLGLFKEHIGDYVDWAFSDFRTWGLHFIHKHEGKADPWLARSCVNLLGLEKGRTILDPFCGSGTFIADAPLMGLNAVGVDVNPLSTMISRVKCSLTDIPLPELREAILEIGKERPSSRGHKDELDQILTELDDKDKRRILDKEAIALKILSIKEMIDGLSTNTLTKDFLYTMLSRVITTVFDKRINNVNITNGFLRDALRFYLYAFASQRILDRLNFQVNCRCNIFTANAWMVKGILNGEVDGIVTSPPYFDALDYYGSSSLQIAFLSLSGRDEHLQSRIIGSNERTASDTDLFLYDLLPESSQLLIKELLRVGREKKARVILHYLNDMCDCLHSFSEVLGEGNRGIFVVGRYHNWKLGNRDALLDGAQILIDIAEQVGFKLEDEMPHNISKIDPGNRIKAESIIILRKGGETPSKRDPERSRRALVIH